jgi:succinoglycan biosynthesis protein ExoA
MSEARPEVEAVCPSVSIVIPMRNEVKHIAACLDSVLRQAYPLERIQILVVDAMSEDGSRQIVQRYASLYPGIHLLDNPARVTPAGFNMGIRHATGEYVTIVSSHCVLPSDYLRKCVDYSRTTDAQNVGGRMRALGTGPVSQAIALVTNSPFGIGGSRFHYSNTAEYVDTVYSGFYPRRVFEEIGLFDERFIRNQDYEFNHRLRVAGGRIYYTPDIIIDYYARDSWWKFVKQYFQYGYWRTRTIYKHPASVKLRHLVPPGFVGTVLISMVLSIFIPALRWPWLGLLAMYALFLIYASWRTTGYKKRRFLFLLPGYFATLHVAWGSGVLWGLVTLPFARSRFNNSQQDYWKRQAWPR